MKAKALHARDAAKRKQLGWPMAFIAPKFPKPETPVEKVARSICRAEIDHSLTVHVYDVVELVERGVQAGMELARTVEAEE